jgi:hypothetical protein
MGRDQRDISETSSQSMRLQLLLIHRGCLHCGKALAAPIRPPCCATWVNESCRKLAQPCVSHQAAFHSKTCCFFAIPFFISWFSLSSLQSCPTVGTQDAAAGDSQRRSTPPPQALQQQGRRAGMDLANILLLLEKRTLARSLTVRLAHSGRCCWP